MLSRCWSISRHSALARSTNLTNLKSLRNHHVMASSSPFNNRAEKLDNKSSNTSLNELVLQRLSAHRGLPVTSRRNFSLTSSVLASPVVTVNSVEQLQIPDVPTTPVTDTFVQSLAANGEPTFASLGLGGYSPIGLLQNGLEFLHVSCDMPWYLTIAFSTVIIRTLLTPLVIIAQRNAATMQNIMPEMQEIQNKLTEAREMGNAHEYAQHNQELMGIMKARGFNPLKNMLIPFAQMPIFLSYFIGIRRMVNAPVESLHDGGILWFTDLTLADPYYLLPLLTCSTLALTIHLGTESARIPGKTSPLITNVMKAMPIVIFPFIMNFPTAMVVYWASSNMVSLIQGQIFRIPRVRTFFNIPQIMKHNLPVKPKEKKTVVQTMKGAWSNMKLAREVEDRRRLDQINFEKAGTGPIVRTYKFDPTKAKKAEQAKN